MLNISKNSVASKIDPQKYSALRRIEQKTSGTIIVLLAKWCFLILFAISLMPWTQNVRTSGQITTVNPEQRPQDIQSVISGRIKEWKVKEGDFVQKGDTIAILTEIKDEYFDDRLLERTKNQLQLKKKSVQSYSGKIEAQNNQLDALVKRRELEIQKLKVQIGQLKLRIQNDSMDYQAAKMDAKIASYQFQRMDSLYQRGLKSLADYETRKLKAQQASAKELSALNKWESNQNEMLNLQLELNNINTRFENDYSKALSDKFSTETSQFDAQSSINKMENQFSNYEVRKTFHAMRAPQDGYVTKLWVQGLGETVKEGAPLLSFMPKDFDLSVEIFVDPIDLPLMKKGEKVRVQFDGWPAIVFSGWPGASYGTYGAEIYAIDQFIHSNGKFRILVKPDPSDHPWPRQLRVGSGAKALILLNDVPIWYEIWRKTNGFPPEFYTSSQKSQK